MSSATLSHPFAARSVAVARMHLTDRLTVFVMPTAVVAAAFVLNIVIWQFVPPDGRQTGGAASLPFFLLVAAAFAVARGLPFALGMGASRRAFVVGTGLVGLVLGLTFGTALLLLGAVERLTGGWWLHGKFFAFPWLDRSAWPVVWLLLVLGMICPFALGALASSVYARWSVLGVVVAVPAAVLVVGAWAVVVTAQGWWHDVGHWFASLTPLSASGWLAVLTVVLTAATWGALRRVRA